MRPSGSRTHSPTWNLRPIASPHRFHTVRAPARAQLAGFEQPLQEQVEVRKPAVWVPAADGRLDALVVERRPAVQPAGEALSGAHAAPGEDVQAHEPPSPRVLPPPPTHPVRPE